MITNLAAPLKNPIRKASRGDTTFALVAAFGTTILLLAAIGWAMTATHGASERATSRTSTLHHHIDQLIYLDEALTMTANMVVRTGQPQWTARYARLAGQYGDESAALRRHLATPDLAAAYTSAGRAADTLFGLEREALGLWAKGDAAAAAAVLSSRPYSDAKRDYAGATQALHRATARELTGEVAAMTKRNRIVIATLCVLVPLCVFAWSRGIRATRAFLRQKAEAERALRASEERFHLAARATSEMIWDWDIAGEQVWFSEAFTTCFGYRRSGGFYIDVWYAGIHPDDLERVKRSLHDFLDGTGDTWSGEYRFRDGEGQWRDVFDRGFAVRDDAGRAVRMTGALMDVTERNAANRQLASALALNEMVLGSIADGIFVLDREGRTTYVNAAAASMLGADASALLGRQMHELVHHSRENGEPYAWTSCPSFDTLRTGVGQQRDDEVLWSLDGRPIAVELTSGPMLDQGGQLAGAVVTFRDVTARRGVERTKERALALLDSITSTGRGGLSDVA